MLKINKHIADIFESLPKNNERKEIENSTPYKKYVDIIKIRHQKKCLGWKISTKFPSKPKHKCKKQTFRDLVQKIQSKNSYQQTNNPQPYRPSHKRENTNFSEKQAFQDEGYKDRANNIMNGLMKSSIFPKNKSSSLDTNEKSSFADADMHKSSHVTRAYQYFAFSEMYGKWKKSTSENKEYIPQITIYSSSKKLNSKKSFNKNQKENKIKKVTAYSKTNQWDKKYSNHKNIIQFSMHNFHRKK